jgi:hypothetical protein
VPDSFDEIETPSQRLLKVAPVQQRPTGSKRERGCTAFSSANVYDALIGAPMPPALGGSTRFVLRSNESCLIIGEPLSSVDASISAASEIVASAEVALWNLHSALVASVSRFTRGRGVGTGYGAPVTFGETGVTYIEWQTGFCELSEAAGAKEEFLRLWCAPTLAAMLVPADVDVASSEASAAFAAMEAAEKANRQKLAAELDEDRQAWLFARDE